MKLAAYLYVFRGIDYDLPFQPIIESLSNFCDYVLVGTDKRFGDGTYQELEQIKQKHGNVNLKVWEFDFNAQNIHGTIKQTLRESMPKEMDWLLEVDADEYIRIQDGERLRTIITSLPPNVYIVGTGLANFFNGNNIHHGMPKIRPCLSRNFPTIKHGAPARMGSEYVSDMGLYKGPAHIVADTSHIEKGIKNENQVWTLHYGWYSLPRKWEMKQTRHYFEGRLSGHYNSLDDYTKNLDKEDVSFWDLPWIMPLENYKAAIIREMKHKDIKPIKFEHPEQMKDWINRQRVYNVQSHPFKRLVFPI